MQGWQKATGLIIKKSRNRENDQLLVIYTKELGKVMVSARGSQKITSRRLGAIDTLNFVSIVVREHHPFYTLKEVSLISSLQTLKTDYQKKRRLLYILEVIDKLTSFGQVDIPLYRFLKQFLVTNAEEGLDEDSLFSQTLKLLQILGYTLPPQSFRSWATLEKYLESLSEKNLLSREL